MPWVIPLLYLPCGKPYNTYVIYLDNNATTRPTQEVVRAVASGLEDLWHNPSSVYRAGQAARASVERARSQFATLLGVRPRELTFTSGGTESIDLALRGCIGVLAQRQPANQPPPLFITSLVEHAAVRDLAKELEETGRAKVAYAQLDPQGRVLPQSIQALLAANTGPALVSIQWANNETGALQPMAEIHDICRSFGVLLHCDAVQWVGKVPTLPNAVAEDSPPSHRHRDPSPGLPCDLLTCAAHKFHGPKGVGALWVRTGVRIQPRLIGTQELGRRGGTENVAGIIGAGVAASQAAQWLSDPAHLPPLVQLLATFEHRLLAACPGSHINGPPAGPNRLWNTLNISFPALEAEAILLSLSEAGICASAGAACSSGSLDPSPVLLAMGVPERSAHGALRFSISRFTTSDELTQAVPIIARTIAKLGATLPRG